MPISLKELQQKRATVTVEFMGDAAQVTYLPAKLTPATREELTAEKAEAQIALLVESWDVLGEDGHPLPVTPENIAALPDAFLVAVLNSINGHMFPNVRRAAT